MYGLRRFVAATDGSDHGACAVVSGAALALRAGASLDVVSVVETLLPPTVSKVLKEDAADYEDRLLEQARRRACVQTRGSDMPEASVHVASGLAAPTIARLAEDLAADMIIVGAHPRPEVVRFLVGSTAERVIRLAGCPVLAATGRRRASFRHILAAVDLSAHACITLRVAAAIARQEDAFIRVLHVHEPYPAIVQDETLYGEEDLLGIASDAYQTMTEGFDGDVELDVRERRGNAGPEILSESDEWGADLIVLGSHGFGFFNRMLLGSTSLHVLRHGHVATLVVPPAAAQRASGLGVRV